MNYSKLHTSLFILLVIAITNCAYSQKLTPKPLWSIDTKQTIHSSPTIDSNLVYFGSGDSCLYAVNIKTGAVEWKYKTKGQITTKPTVYKKLVIFHSKDRKIYALDKKTGKKIWTNQGWRGSNGTYKGNITVTNDIVAVGNKDGKLYVFHVDAPGISGCEYKTEGPIWSTPLIIDHNIIFGGHDKKIHSINSSCKLIWEKELSGIIATGIAHKDNKIFFGSYDYNIYSLNIKNGEVIWKHPTKSIITSSPLIVENTVNIGSLDNNLYQLNIENGNLNWVFNTQGKISSKPTYHNGTIWTSSFDKKVYGIDFESGKLKTEFQLEGKISSSPAISDKRLIIGSWKGKIHAFKIKK